MARTADYWGLLRSNRDFRTLWVAQVGSNAGDSFNEIAILGLVLSLTDSPAAVGFLTIASLLPIAAISPIAGLWIDSIDRRKLMIGSDLVRVILALGFLLIRAPEFVWLAYLLIALLRSLGAIFWLPA